MLDREQVEKKTICMKCRYCKQETIEHTHWTEFRHFCTNSVTYVDPVTGDETYCSCSLVNIDGNCPSYKRPDVSRLNRFLDFVTGKKD